MRRPEEITASRRGTKLLTIAGFRLRRFALSSAEVTGDEEEVGSGNREPEDDDQNFSKSEHRLFFLPQATSRFRSVSCQPADAKLQNNGPFRSSPIGQPATFLARTGQSPRDDARSTGPSHRLPPLPSYGSSRAR